jgi:hypothetical protein
MLRAGSMFRLFPIPGTEFLDDAYCEEEDVLVVEDEDIDEGEEII